MATGVQAVSEPGVSVVVPCYRHRRVVGFAIQSLEAQRLPDGLEIIVVDAAGEGLTNWLRVPHPRVRVVTSEQRLTPGAARNLGAAEARGSWLAFLDADAEAHPAWLSILRDRLVENGDLICAGGFIANRNARSPAATVLHWIEFSEFLPGSPGGRRRFLSSCNLLFRREVFAATGGFPEHVEAGEDLLFFVRRPASAWFEPTTGVVHRTRSRWGDVRVHLRHLGWWSGRLRGAGLPPAPARLGPAPAAVAMLAAYRTAVVLGRVVRSNPGRLPAAAVLSPLVAYGCLTWARGFLAGWRVGRQTSRL